MLKNNFKNYKFEHIIIKITMVSIITPAHNSEKYIKQTIESVLNQTYQNWELIIIDDYSSDNTVEIAKQYQDYRIKIISLKINVGAAEARNIGLRMAKGKYIAFLDSDDLWKKDKLEKQLKFMIENNYAFSFSSYQLMNEDGTITTKTVRAPSVLTYDKYLKNTAIGCLTVIIDKEKTGYFEFPQIKSSHDMALWLNIMKRGFNAYGYSEVLAYYRLTNNSISSNKIKSAKTVWKVYRDIEKLNFFKSLYCFTFYALNSIKRRLLS